MVIIIICEMFMTLSVLTYRQLARIIRLPDDPQLSAKLIEQGFFPSTEIELAHKAPFSGPSAFYLHGTKVSLHASLADKIEVELIS